MRPVRALLALATFAALPALGACNLQISDQAEAKSEWKKDYAVAAGASLEIRNTNGPIDVEAVDGTTISVVAERIAKAATDQAAKEAAEGIEIRETVSGSGIVLDAKTSVSGIVIGIGGGGRQVKFHIKAPKGTTLRLSNTNGTIDVRDITGDVNLSTTNGRIRGAGLAGAARVETTNGEVDLDYTAMPAGGVTVETTNGGVSVRLPTDAKARLEARVTNGGIDTEGLNVSVSEQSRRRLSATLNGGGPEVRVETTNGGVRIRAR